MTRSTTLESPHRRSSARWVAVLALALLAPAATVAGTLTAGSAVAGGCPDTKEFAVGGVGDTHGQHVPGAPRDATGIVYPASLAPVGFTPGDVSAARGERALNSQARAFRARCPESAIHVTGYSFGALVAGNVRDDWNRDPKMRQNTSFTLVADPRADHGAMAKLPSVIPGFTHTGPRPAGAIPTSSVCRAAADFVCYVGNPLENPLPLINGLLGYAAGDHGYRRSEVSDVPGEHTVAGPTRVGAPVDLAATDGSEPAPLLSLEVTVQVNLAVLPNPAELEPVLAVAQDIARTVAPELVPPAEVSLTRYIPTPLRDYAPPVLAGAVPEELGSVVLPPLPTIREAHADETPQAAAQQTAPQKF
ncbi:PE-PPE domain-containing protein [Gordonia alkaliphila]|uniref:cutinase family protein n=1 Tax=Gordonia alkaliphila TaxID=1053547 RepID=UPI001FF6612F|nr:PE-PPE domain-containing protein [Gordonia alkaliphila]MCK0439060.1 PE-PPE domain-containing protein [Gordonia alkaliphila]